MPAPRISTEIGTSPVEAEVRFRLRLEIELPLESPDLFRCLQAHRQSPRLLSVKSAPEVRVLPSAGITRHQRYYHPFRFPPAPPPEVTLRPLPSPATGLPRLPLSPSLRAVPTTPADRNGCIRRLLPRSTRPSLNLRRVGVHIFTFEACSGFTRVRPARSLNRPRRPLSQGFGPPVTRQDRLSATRSNRQLSGWILPPLVLRAVGAH